MYTRIGMICQLRSQDIFLLFLVLKSVVMTCLTMDFLGFVLFFIYRFIDLASFGNSLVIIYLNYLSALPLFLSLWNLNIVNFRCLVRAPMTLFVSVCLCFLDFFDNFWFSVFKITFFFHCLLHSVVVPIH